MAVFEGRKSSNDIIINDKMSDDEELFTSLGLNSWDLAVDDCFTY